MYTSNASTGAASYKPFPFQGKIHRSEDGRCMPLKLLAHDYPRVPRLEVRLVLNSQMCIFAKPLEIIADTGCE